MRRRKKGRKGKEAGRVVRLEDLAPRQEVRGGSGKLLFGERADPAGETGRRAGGGSDRSEKG